MPDGSAYDGEWADGLRDGRGTLFLASGDQFTGPWCVRDTHAHTRACDFVIVLVRTLTRPTHLHSDDFTAGGRV